MIVSRPDDATGPGLEVLERRVEAMPSDPMSRHNLAVGLRHLGRPEAALEQAEKALSLGSAPPESRLLRAHLLGDLGRFDEAVEQYRALIDGDPEMIAAHESLSKLLPQIGRRDEALDSYRRALSLAPGNGLLWVSALAMAKAQGENAQLLGWARAAEARFGADTMLKVYEAMALSALGQAELARDRLIAAIREDPDYTPAYGTLAHVQLKAGDPSAAAASATEAVRRNPEDQSSLALLGTAWQLSGDPRTQWLLDYERLVMPIDLSGLDLKALAEFLTRLHLAGSEPAEQSLRRGTQTRDNLFDKADPGIQHLAETIRREVDAKLARLPIEPGHPFLRRNTGAIAFSGSWSVRLRDSGFHISHIHPLGWLSSACYIALPPEIGGSEAAGALEFGVPDAALGLDLAPALTLIPSPGRLFVFPSYFWHGTRPFSSESPRLTVAFDALPVDRGTPRR